MSPALAGRFFTTEWPGTYKRKRSPRMLLFKGLCMPLAASNSTVILRSGELKHARMNGFQVWWGKYPSLPPKQDWNGMDCWNVRYTRPENHSDFPSSCFDRVPDRHFWENVSNLYWARVNNLIVCCCLLGIRIWRPPDPEWLVYVSRLSDPCKMIPAGWTGLADLIFTWMSYSCGESLSIICLFVYNAKLK